MVWVLTDGQLYLINTTSTSTGAQTRFLLRYAIGGYHEELCCQLEDFSHDWFVVDATDLIQERLATQVAMRLGQHKPFLPPTWTPVISSWWLTPKR
ncbi:hypothetical protein DFAR_2840003 [Desulfarculales bacterium]